MQLHLYAVHLYKDVRGQRRNANMEAYAESPERAIGNVRLMLRRQRDPMWKWDAEARLKGAGS